MCEPCFSFLFLFFCLFLVISNRIAGSETVAPHTYFRSCGSNFCGGKILDHEERYVFTILFFPGLGRGLDPEWRWLSVTCNFLLMKKKKRVILPVQSFSFLIQVESYASQLAGLSVVRVVYQWQKGNVMLSPGWLRVASQGSSPLWFKSKGSWGGDIITTGTSQLHETMCFEVR